MKINSTINQNFGARIDTNTEILIREAKSLGIKTSKMEKLMEEVYSDDPNSIIETELYYDGDKMDVVKMELTHSIGPASLGIKTVFKNYIEYMPPFYLIPKQNLGIKKYYIENMIKNLKKIKNEVTE